MHLPALVFGYTAGFLFRPPSGAAATYRFFGRDQSCAEGMAQQDQNGAGLGKFREPFRQCRDRGGNPLLVGPRCREDGHGRSLRIEPGRTAQDQGAPTSGYRFRHVAMDLRDLTNAASYYAEATEEDALLTEVARAIFEWNASLGKAWGQVRVTVPIDHRGPEEKHLSLGNRAGYGTVVLDLTEVAGNPLASVSAQTKHLRREAAEADRVARAFAEPWAPFGLRRALKRPADRRTASRVDTTMLAHVGSAPPLRFGAVRTGALWYAPPAPLPMGLAVGAVHYGNRMHLTLRYRRSLFTTPPFWGRG